MEVTTSEVKKQTGCRWKTNQGFTFNMSNNGDMSKHLRDSNISIDKHYTNFVL